MSRFILLRWLTLFQNGEYASVSYMSDNSSFSECDRAVSQWFYSFVSRLWSVRVRERLIR